MTVGILQKFVSTGSYVDICYLVPHAKDPKILDVDTATYDVAAATYLPQEVAIYRHY